MHEPSRQPTSPASSPRLSQAQEMQLVQAWRDGDADALAKLLQAYQRRVYSICYRMLRNPEDASDLTQDALVKMLENLDDYDGRAKLSTWVIRITINACISHLRKKKVRQAGSLDSGALDDAFGNAPVGDAADRRSDGELSAPQRIEQDETRQALHEAMMSLDPDMRAVLVLRDMQGLEYEQLAHALEVPVGTIKSRIFRARVALRDAVQQRLPE